MPRRLTALNSGAASTPNSGADSSAAALHYVPWSMREEHASHAKSGGSDALQSGGSDALARDGQPASCIVCFETEETKPGVDWHGCCTCSACWCDPCMAAMFDTARDHEDDVELTCPQCRGSIADMQEQSRRARIKGSLECSEETARDIVAYENLLTEVVHLCECEETGLPYFTIPAETVSWIMSRDPICTIVQDKQGPAEGTRLRRMLRASDYPGADDSCDRPCGEIFEPFWDSCGEMLAAMHVGGTEGMTVFYDSCLATLYPPGWHPPTRSCMLF